MLYVICYMLYVIYVMLCYVMFCSSLAFFQGKLLQNVCQQPSEAKFRKLKLSNARIAALLAEPGALGAFETLGWQPPRRRWSCRRRTSSCWRGS